MKHVSLAQMMGATAMAIVAYDALASLAALAIGFPYASAGFGSALVYAAAGFLAARKRTFRFSLIIGAVAGVVDATAGWGVSWVLGPGRTPDGMLTIARWMATASFVLVLAVVCAAIGGLLGKVSLRVGNHAV